MLEGLSAVAMAAPTEQPTEGLYNRALLPPQSAT